MTLKWLTAEWKRGYMDGAFGRCRHVDNLVNNGPWSPLSKEQWHKRIGAWVFQREHPDLKEANGRGGGNDTCTQCSR